MYVDHFHRHWCFTGNRKSKNYVLIFPVIWHSYIAMYCNFQVQGVGTFTYTVLKETGQLQDNVPFLTVNIFIGICDLLYAILCLALVVGVFMVKHWPWKFWQKWYIFFFSGKWRDDWNLAIYAAPFENCHLRELYNDQFNVFGSGFHHNDMFVFLCLWRNLCCTWFW